MKRSILAYGVAVAAGAFLLQWLEHQHAVRLVPTPIFVAVVALLFTVLGIYVGHRLTPSAPAGRFERNDDAITYLGISERE